MMFAWCMIATCFPIFSMMFACSFSGYLLRVSLSFSAFRYSSSRVKGMVDSCLWFKLRIFAVLIPAFIALVYILASRLVRCFRILLSRSRCL